MREGELSVGGLRRNDGGARRKLGDAARARAVAEFSWAGHCARLAEAMEQALARRGRERSHPS